MSAPNPDGFLAIPPSGNGPGVLVLHAWWGLNDTIKNLCARLADAGFVAFAPDLYRGKVTDTIAGAEALCKEMNEHEARAKGDIADATALLVSQTGRNDIAVLGFSLGAYFALETAAADPEHVKSVVLYYGTGGRDHGNSRASYLIHAAENDEFEPKESVDALVASLKAAGLEVTLHIYGRDGHWFAEPDREDVYNAQAAELAFDRTVEFLRANS